MNRPLSLPLAVLADSYKATHSQMYQEADVMTAYAELRTPYNKDHSDSRFIAFGLRYIIESYVQIQWTEQDVQQAECFFSTHNVGNTPYPFPKDLFLKFIKENNGYFPVIIQALPEGTVANIHTPVFQITAEGEYSRLVTFLETILTQMWYPTTVATLSRRAKDLIEQSWQRTVDPEFMPMVVGTLVDFGARGCTSVEQAVLGGCSHLLNFESSDNMPAAYYAQFVLNNGKPVATTVAASEHSVMTSFLNEKDAIDHMIDTFGGEGKAFSVVMDSYDYKRALYEILPTVQLHCIEKGGTIVLRPDSGDAVEAVLMGLDAAEKVFGVTINSKGFKVLKNCRIIQGDGINIEILQQIIEATEKKGFSHLNVVYGLGSGLLQKVNRDTMSFATKLCCIVNKLDDKKTLQIAELNKQLSQSTPTTAADPASPVVSQEEKHIGYECEGYYVRPVMKLPATDSGKISLPGKLRVVRDPAHPGGLSVRPDFNVFPHDSKQAEVNRNTDDLKNELVVVYNKGPVAGVWDDFETVRKRAEQQWHATQPTFNPISAELQQEIDRWSHLYKSNYQQ